MDFDTKPVHSPVFAGRNLSFTGSDSVNYTTFQYSIVDENDINNVFNITRYGGGLPISVTATLTVVESDPEYELSAPSLSGASTTVVLSSGLAIFTLGPFQINRLGRFQITFTCNRTGLVSGSSFTSANIFEVRPNAATQFLPFKSTLPTSSVTKRAMGDYSFVLRDARTWNTC